MKMFYYSVKFERPSKLGLRILLLGFLYLLNLTIISANEIKKNDLKAFFDSLPELKIPYISIDRNWGTLNNEHPLLKEQLEALSMNKVDKYNSWANDEKEVSVCYRIGIVGDFYIIWAKIYALGIKAGGFESVLISYDKNFEYIGNIEFNGNCLGQCDCFIYSTINNNYIKNITFSPCPSEDGENERLIGSFNKYKINKDGSFSKVQKGSSSIEQFNYCARMINSKENKGIGIINDNDGFTNIRSKQNSDSKIIGKVFNGETFYYWEDVNQNWWLIENKDGIEGFMHKSRIKK